MKIVDSVILVLGVISGLGAASPVRADDFTPTQTLPFTISGAKGDQETFVSPSFKSGPEHRLRVRITPLAAGPQVAFNEKYPNLNTTSMCNGFTVSALDQSVATASLGIDGGDPLFCPTASQTIDFSSALGQAPVDVQIQIGKARYSYFCQLMFLGVMSGNFSEFCPLHDVYSTHHVKGKIEIEIK